MKYFIKKEAQQEEGAVIGAGDFKSEKPEV